MKPQFSSKLAGFVGAFSMLLIGNATVEKASAQCGTSSGGYDYGYTNSNSYGYGCNQTYGYDYASSASSSCNNYNYSAPRTTYQYVPVATDSRGTSFWVLLKRFFVRPRTVVNKCLSENDGYYSGNSYSSQDHRYGYQGEQKRNPYYHNRSSSNQYRVSPRTSARSGRSCSGGT